MSTKHTPGQWCLDPTNIGIGVITDNGAFKPVAICPPNYIDDTETEANARLIAAAPELLEALLAVQANNRLMNALNNQDRATVDLIQAAITKATGGAE